MDILLYVGIVVFSVTQSACAKGVSDVKNGSAIFNVIKVFSALLFFGCLSFLGLTFHLPTLWLSIAYGVSLAVSMYTGYMALHTGPMALTSMLVSFSVIIPVLCGFIFWGEAVTLFRIFGFVLLVLAILFSKGKKLKVAKDDDKQTKSRAWVVYVALTFITNGMCSVVQKVHQTQFPGGYSTEFMLYAMGVCAIIYMVVSAISTPIAKTKELLKNKKFILLALLAGITNGVVNYFTIILAGRENASVLFPTISVGVILGTLVCGRFIYKEKLNIFQLIAIVSGIVAIVFLKI